MMRPKAAALALALGLVWPAASGADMPYPANPHPCQQRRAEMDGGGERSADDALAQVTAEAATCR